jgi:hypothetical protein
MRELNQAEGGVTELAESVESRHQALAMVLAELQGEKPPRPSPVAAATDPVVRVQSFVRTRSGCWPRPRVWPRSAPNASGWRSAWPA